jgi:hypothetical protein
MPTVTDGVAARIFDDPIALDDHYSVGEGTTLTLPASSGLLVNDGDPAGGSVTVNLITDSVDNGTLSVFSDGRVNYTPDAGFVGLDSFDYRIVDNDGNTATATAFITVYANSAPFAVDDVFAVREGETLNIAAAGILANDLDTAGEALTVSLITDGADNGSLAVFADGRVNYTPNAGFSGTDSFTYRITDSSGERADATASITVVENPGPFAGDDFYSVQRNTTFTLAADGILANDIDPDGSTLTVSLITDGVDNGSLSVFGSGNLIYTPDAGFTGLDQFTYRMRDDFGNIAQATVTFNVVADLPPIATDDVITLREGDDLNLLAPGILTNDLDPEGGALEVVLITDGVDDGTLSVFGDGRVVYTPDFTFVGTDSFTYRIRDDQGNSDEATASLIVVPNLPPVALDDAYSVSSFGSLSIDASNGVLANDVDPDGGALTVSLITDGVDNGTLAVFANGNFTYTPTAGFAGTDSFTYRIRDSDGNIDTATVSISVYFPFFLTAPFALDDNYAVSENDSLSISAADGVLSNDVDPQGDDLTVNLILDGVDNGTLAVFGDGRFEYTPDSGFFGTDSFTYRVSDPDGNNTDATVTLEVLENLDPVAGADSYAVLRGTTLMIAEEDGLLVNDLDPEGTDLTVSLITDGVDNGTLAVFGGGNFTYTPDANFVGTDSFSYRVRDEHNQFTTQTVTLNVVAPPEPIATQDEYTVLQGRDLSVAAAEGVLFNDLSLDGSNLNVVLITDGVDNGTLSVFGDGRFNYTPDTGFTGTDSFAYRVRSDNGGVATGTVDLNVVEDPAPVASDDIYSVIAGGSLNIAAPDGVLANDIDPAGDALSVTVITDGADNGTLAVFADGRFNYTPDAGFSGTDMFTYRVTDAFGISSTADVTINVIPPADPIALDDAYFTTTGATLNIPALTGVLANDVSPDGAGISVILITDGVDNGALSVFADGRFTYTPDAGFAGVDSFTYRIRDDFGNIATAEVAIGVAGNAPPIVEDDVAVTLVDQQVVIDVLANDIDPNGDAMFPASLSDPANGSVFASFGVLIYTPDPGFVGVDTFTYRAFDVGGLSTEGTVTVTVNPVVLPDVNYDLSAVASVAEGDAGSQPLIVSLTRDDASDAATVELGYSGDATLGVDYTTDAATSVSFAIGETSKDITLSVLGDTDVEPDEDITVTITDVVSPRTFVGDAATITILNDDVVTPPPTLNEIIDGDGSGVLIGTAGRDSLQSNAGNYDRMTGGAGEDEFEFGLETMNGVRERDVITDYEVGLDVIRLVEGAQVLSLTDISSGVLVTFAGDGDRAYVRGDGVTSANLVILDEDDLILV